MSRPAGSAEPAAEHDAAASLVDALLDHVEASRIAAAVELFEPDGVLEMPYRPGGFDTELRGVAQIAEFLGVLPRLFPTLSLLQRKVYRTVDPRIIFCEYQGDGISRSGRAYKNRYMSLFRLGETGRVALWREYFDPVIVMESLRPMAGD